MSRAVGIIGYGTYIPKYRIAVGEIASVWNKEPADIVRSLGVKEKAVPSSDEDAVTIGIAAASDAIGSAGVKPSEIGAVFVGSESKPYAVNPSSTIIADFLNIGNAYLAADLEFACKAGTAGMQAVAGLVASGRIHAGLAIGADTAQSRPHDVLEYTSAAAGAAYIIGAKHPIAHMTEYCSYSSDTPDFWRRDGIRYPSHAGRFTGEPAYYAHVMGAAEMLMKKANVSPSDVDYCVFHMPNGKFPRDVAKRLGFTGEQLAPSLVVDHIGNPYSASMMCGLAATLDEAKPSQTIFAVSYGSGAGSDAFLFKTTGRLTNVQSWRRANEATVSSMLRRTETIGYAQYLKETRKI